MCIQPTGKFMKEDQYTNELLEEQEEKTDYRALLFRYLIHWPWFVASVVLCLAGGWLYLKRTAPVYRITSTVLIQDDQKNGTNAGGIANLQELGLLNYGSSNIDNEMEILRSKSIVRDAVCHIGAYIRYSTPGTFRDTDLYGASPIEVDFAPEDAERLRTPLELDLTRQTDGKTRVQIRINGGLPDEEVQTKLLNSLPVALPTRVGTLTFRAASHTLEVGRPVAEATRVQVRILPPLAVATDYQSSLTVELTGKTTSIATLTVLDTQARRGEDFLKALVAMYNRDANNDKDLIAQNTARFIDDRIAAVNGELGSTEVELESFKRQAGLTDLSSDAQQAVTERSGYEKLSNENATQINLINYLADYLNNPDNANSVLPVNVGLNDPSIAALISQYNAQVLERNRLLRTSSEENPVIRRLTADLRNMHANLVTTVSSARKALLITQANLNAQASKYAGRVSSAPTQERELANMQRQQSVKEALYLMLLQKREENNIALAATSDNAKIIDAPLAGGAVSPDNKQVLLAAGVAGLALPAGIIFLIGFFRYRIEGRADVERLTRVPVVGDVPLSDKNRGGLSAIVVRENENDVMAETFRSLRTNLLFMLDGPDRKVILTTSTQSGEGKTFVAANLATSFALLGKKVILLGLDIRKPGLNKIFSFTNRDRGITAYLAAPDTTDLHSLIRPSGVVDNFHILPGGTVPPNPTELLARPSLDRLIAALKQEYDYVILDTAPIGMVTDTQIIARTADVSLYVCRADYTAKGDFSLINDLARQHRLPGLCTVINGIDMKRKKYGYYYGYGKYGKYGKYYGYGRKYGYGYGYGDSGHAAK